jgi:hypothetical protein
MKPKIVLSVVLATASCFFLSGCGNSSSTTTDNAKSTATPDAASKPATGDATSSTQAATPPPPTAPANLTAATSGSGPADSQAATATAAPDAAGAVEQVSQFATTAAAQPDKVAASIGSELAEKTKSLAQSAAGNSELKSRVAGALASLSSGKDASALGSLFQEAKQANLTPRQTQLAKDVGNLASAYVVQRNFSSLDGAQGDVATIVNSLRKGSVTQAVPALESLAKNTSLTSQQKDLLGTLADQYAPGLKKASDSLKQGLQGLQGLTK